MVDRYAGRRISSSSVRYSSIIGGTSPSDLTDSFQLFKPSTRPGITPTVVMTGVAGVVPSACRSVSRSTCTPMICTMLDVSEAESRHQLSGIEAIGPDSPSGSASSCRRSSLPLKTLSSVTAALSKGWTAGNSEASSGVVIRSSGLTVDRID